MPDNSDFPNQGDIFNTAPLPADAYPMNASGQQKTIRFIRQDIKESENYLIITGYSSLAYLIEELGKPKMNAGDCVEIVLGNEPVAFASAAGGSMRGKRSGYSASQALRLPDEIRQFWLEQGISVLLNGPVLYLIEKIKYGKVSFFYRANLHAKVYKGDGAVMMGSSNFSKPGMETQYEANIRREFGQDGFYEISQIAEHYRKDAIPWNDEMIALLEELLREMSWQETLSRALALILEGDWIEQYPDAWRLQRSSRLWPTQRKGIAQALYLLEMQGSVLVADPTGSGKTRMGAKLLEALLNRLWMQLNQHRSKYLIVCPPLVRDGWRKELRHLNWNTSDPVSHGLLSNPDSTASAAVLEEMKNAHILLIDEAHNYLNKSSARSRSVVVNRADHIILFTATPINRRSDDILRLVEILGLDNLDDNAYKTYKKLLNAKDNRKPEHMDQLRNYVNRFMVRRTKHELNRAIDKEPEAYTDQFGDLCRYPKSRAYLYETKETEHDKRIAEEIEEKVKQLRGIIYITNLKADAYDRKNRERQELFIKKRMAMAPALTRYNIRNMLRSSRAALVEHLKGTAYAMETFRIAVFKQGETGNIIESIRTASEKLPDTNLTIELPDYLKNLSSWKRACEVEIKLLEDISELACSMSESRENGKAMEIIRRLKEHDMMLVYDTALITLNLMKQLMDDLGYGRQSMVVTGSTERTKKELTSKFALEAKSVKMAALCSDAMAEGVNLQRASAVLFLDMPSVIRIAEQRIGRVERMDSPHKEVAVYWPNDSEAFRLRTDRNFYHRHQMVENLIGSNITLPDEMMEQSAAFDEETLSTEQVIAEFDRHQEDDRSWEGFEDAFGSLRGLIGDQDALIAEELYTEVAQMKATNGTWISVVSSDEPYVFMAIKGSGSAAPLWILKRGDRDPIQEINEITTYLKRVLKNTEQEMFDDEADNQLQSLVNWLNKHEQDMLPNKKRNALNQMSKMADYWTKHQDEYKFDEDWSKLVKQLRRQISPSSTDDKPDWYELANRWLDITQPVLIHWLENERKNRKYHNIRLQDINKYLRQHPHGVNELHYLLKDLPMLEPSEQRIVAVIIGKKGKNSLRKY